DNDALATMLDTEFRADGPDDRAAGADQKRTVRVLGDTEARAAALQIDLTELAAEADSQARLGVDLHDTSVGEGQLTSLALARRHGVASRESVEPHRQQRRRRGGEADSQPRATRARGALGVARGERTRRQRKARHITGRAAFGRAALSSRVRGEGRPALKLFQRSVDLRYAQHLLDVQRRLAQPVDER